MSLGHALTNHDAASTIPIPHHLHAGHSERETFALHILLRLLLPPRISMPLLLSFLYHLRYHVRFLSPWSFWAFADLSLLPGSGSARPSLTALQLIFNLIRTIAVIVPTSRDVDNHANCEPDCRNCRGWAAWADAYVD